MKPASLTIEGGGTKGPEIATYADCEQSLWTRDAILQHIVQQRHPWSVVGDYTSKAATNHPSPSVTRRLSAARALSVLMPSSRSRDFR